MFKSIQRTKYDPVTDKHLYKLVDSTFESTFDLRFGLDIAIQYSLTKEYEKRGLNPVINIDFYKNSEEVRNGNLIIKKENKLNPWDQDVRDYLHTLTESEQDQEEYNLWQLVKPKDICFCVSDARLNRVEVNVCPIAYFKKFRHTLSYSIPIGHLMPRYLTEVQECVWDTDRFNVNTVKLDMLSAGFSVYKEFNDFVKRTADWDQFP